MPGGGEGGTNTLIIYGSRATMWCFQGWYEVIHVYMRCSTYLMYILGVYLTQFHDNILIPYKILRIVYFSF